MKALRVPLRVVFYKEEGDWVAHCLEFDLCGDGKTQQDALGSLSQAIQLQVEDSLEHDNPKNLFTPADGEIFERFFAGKDTTVGELKLSIEPLIVERTEYREYSDDHAGTGFELVST